MIQITSMCGRNCAFCKKQIRVCRSAAGHYLGVFDEDGPFCRITDYYSKEDADEVLVVFNKKRQGGSNATTSSS